LTEAHKAAIRVIRKIKYFVARRKFQVITLNTITCSLHSYIKQRTKHLFKLNSGS